MLKSGGINTEIFKLHCSRHASSSKAKQTVDIRTVCTAQKMKFSIKDFFSKSDQIRSFLRIWSHLLKKSFMKNFIFCALLKTLKLAVRISF